MSKTKFAEKSPLRKSVQPALVVAALILIAYIAYKAYVAIQRGISSAQETLKKKGFTMEGGKANIKVKGIDEQVYIDKTQAAFVNAWTHAETPGYYSRLWSKADPRHKPAKAE